VSFTDAACLTVLVYDVVGAELLCQGPEAKAFMHTASAKLKIHTYGTSDSLSRYVKVKLKVWTLVIAPLT